MSKVYLEVAVPFYIFQTFWYEFNLDKEIDPNFLIGKKVTVPFRNIQTYGIVLNTAEKVELNLEIKPILNINDTPIFSEKDIEIIKKISDYYISPIGMTFDFFIPNFLKGKKIRDDYLDKVLVLNEDIDLTNYKLTESQAKAIDIIKQIKAIYYEELLASGIKKNVLQSLIKKGIVKIVEKKQSLKDIFISEKEKYYKESIDLKNRLMLLNDFYLKDRIKFYLDISNKFLEEGKSILIVFPYISLLDSFYEVFKSKLKDIYIFHDSMKIANQNNVFKQIINQPSLVLGTVSSLFLPIKNLSLIVIEEENSDIYKILRTPKVDVKRIAYYIHKEKNIPLILSSSLPSIETFYLKEKKIISPIKKINKVLNTKIEIFPFASLKDTVIKIKKIIKENENVLIISNKSYYSGLVYCERCGWEAICPTCNVPLKVYNYKNNKIFKCSTCNKKYEFFKKCPNCDFKLKEIGFGKEKIVELLSDKMKNRKIDVVSIFTTTLNQYDTVINIYPDFILDLPDFRVNEKFFENIIFPLTAAKERYIIFTNLKDKIENFLDKNIGRSIEKFYKEELSFRRENNLPPFSKFVKITILERKKHILDSLLKDKFKIKSEYVVNNKKVYIIEFYSESELQTLKDIITGIPKNLVSVEINPKSF